MRMEFSEIHSSMTPLCSGNVEMCVLKNTREFAHLETNHLVIFFKLGKNVEHYFQMQNKKITFFLDAESRQSILLFQIIFFRLFSPILDLRDLKPVL